MRYSFAVCFSLFLILSLNTAEAQSPRCRVMDPTGTPLNVRSAPNGQIVGTLYNGTIVYIRGISYDSKGRSWANVGSGWVYREFLACF